MPDVMKDWNDPGYAHDAIFKIAQRIEHIASRTLVSPEHVERLPLDQTAADAEADLFVQKLQAMRVEFLGVTALRRTIPRPPQGPTLHYNFYKTPNLVFSHIIYQEVDDTARLLEGEAVHVFDDPANPHLPTVSVESMNYGDCHSLPFVSPHYNPWIMLDAYTRLKQAYLEEYVALGVNHPTFGRPLAPDDAIRPFPGFEPDDPDPDQPA